MLHTIWLGMLITGFSLLMISIVLAFAFKVPELVDELSGRKAKRQIKRLKELNKSTNSLENMGTEEVYSAMASGSLLSSEMEKLENAGITADSKVDPEIVDAIEEGKVIVTSSLQESEDEEDSPTTDMSQDEDDLPTGLVDDDVDEGTTLMDEDTTGSVTVSQVKIQVLEEQSSII